MSTRILFVDDDPNVLAGFRRMLHSMRSEWAISFASNGPEALALLEREPHDVVVSDMRMPGMDGAEFLEKVRERSPETIRIILSGNSDRETILRSIGPTHQFLSKPCEPTVLKETILRAEALSTLLSDPWLKSVVGSTSVLPSVPVLFTAMVEELQKPSCSIQSIGDIVSQDPGMTAQVLRLVNSAYFGLRREISSPADAVSYLGLGTVTSLVLCSHIFKQVDSHVASWLGLDSIWRHAMNTGRLARDIVERRGGDTRTRDDALAAGLLHSAGRLILAVNFPEAYESAVILSQGGTMTLCDAERTLMNVTHAEVGAYLLGIWGLPNAIIEAVAYHHAPSECVHRRFSTLTAVHAACALDREACGGKGEAAGADREQAAPGAILGGAGHAGLDLTYLESVGMAEQVPIWRGIRDELAGIEEVSCDQENPAGR